MRVLVCTSEYYPYGSGIANVAYNVVEQLKKMGIGCTVCSPSGPDIKIPYLEGSGRLGLIHFWYNVGNYFKNKATDYDIVWLHYPLFIGNIPFKNCLITVHSTAYGFMNENISPRFYYRVSYLLEKYCLNRFSKESRFTGVSTKTCTELEKILKYKYPIKCILNGVDTSVFKPAEIKDSIRIKFGIPADYKVILSVGRLIDHKMPFLMLDTFNEIQKRTSDKYVLVIAGKGKLSENLKEYVAERNLKNVLFLGFVPVLDLPSLYSSADYFIISSRYEGGEPVLTVAEAMSSGLPCIVSDIPNFKFIKNLDCGVIVDFADIKLASKAILNYLKEDYLNQSFNSRNYVVKNLDWDLLAKKYLEEFNKL